MSRIQHVEPGRRELGYAWYTAIGQTPEQMKELLGNGNVTITLSVK